MGEIGITQVGKSDDHRIMVLPNGTEVKQKKPTSGAYFLDGAAGVQIRGVTRIGENESKSRSDWDSPYAPLGASDKKYSTDYHFRTYLMYRPDNTPDGASIWVTLRVVEWYCTGAATKHAQDNWSMDPGQSSSKDPKSDNSTTLPVWNDYLSNLEWAGE